MIILTYVSLTEHGLRTGEGGGGIVGPGVGVGRIVGVGVGVAVGRIVGGCGVGYVSLTIGRIAKPAIPAILAFSVVSKIGNLNTKESQARSRVSIAKYGH